MTDQFPDLYKGRLSSPFNANVVSTDTGHASDIWEAHLQSITDTINSIINTDLKGVTDGSEAAAGDVGEYLSASASSVAMTTNTATVVTTLTLTAGDWDVTGSVVFHVTSGTTNHYAAGIDGYGQEMVMTAPVGTGTWRLSTGAPVRRNVTTDTVVQLAALCGFSAGTVSCDGVVSARRMR